LTVFAHFRFNYVPAARGTRSSAIAEVPHDVLVSRTLATTNHPIWKRLQSIMTLNYIHPRLSQALLLDRPYITSR